MPSGDGAVGVPASSRARGGGVEPPPDVALRVSSPPPSAAVAAQYAPPPPASRTAAATEAATSGERRRVGVTSLSGRSVLTGSLLRLHRRRAPGRRTARRAGRTGLGRISEAAGSLEPLLHRVEQPGRGG